MMSVNVRRYWATDQCLTRGIYEFEGRPSTLNGDVITGRRGVYQYLLGRDCFETLDEAVRRAQAIQLYEVGKLHETLKRIETLDFARDAIPLKPAEDL